MTANSNRALISFLFGFLMIVTGPVMQARAAEESSRAEREHVRLSAYASQSEIGAGSAMALAVTLDFDDHWHAWPALAQDVLPPEIAEFAIRTDVQIGEQPAWLRTGSTQWPEPKPGKVADLNNAGKKITVPLYQDRATIYVPIAIATDAPVGRHEIKLLVSYQACDDRMCLMPEYDVELVVPITVTATGSNAAPINTEVFAGFETNRLSEIPPRGEAGTTGGEPSPGTATPEQTTGSPANPDGAVAIAPASSTSPGANFFGVSLAGLAESPIGWVGLALLGALGGFILNLTPCVLPVIPIKVLTLTQHAGSPQRSLVLGLWMAFGVVAFWLALGIPASFVAGFADPSIMFGIWWLTAGIGAIIGLMGLGIMGLFTINLPQKLYMVNPEADSPGGSFMFGVMTAVLGLPCFGFVAGALLPVAATIGPAITIVVFTAMGIGMAAPYLVLSAKPSLLKALPKTGPASELVKQVMGLLLLGAATFFIGTGLIALVQDHPYLGKKLHWWFVALLGVAAGGWLALRTFQITPSAGKRLVFSVIGLILAAGGTAAAWSVTQQVRREYMERESALGAAQKTGSEGRVVSGVWLDYSEPLVEAALAQGKTVVLDFTAEWCINCKTLKAAVLSVPPVKPALQNDDVVLFEVDLTSRSAAGWKKLRALGQTGIPLLAVMGPGIQSPWLSNAYTAPQVLEALAQARKPAGSAGTGG